MILRVAGNRVLDSQGPGCRVPAVMMSFEEGPQACRVDSREEGVDEF